MPRSALAVEDLGADVAAATELGIERPEVPVTVVRRQPPAVVGVHGARERLEQGRGIRVAAELSVLNPDGADVRIMGATVS